MPKGVPAHDELRRTYYEDGEANGQKSYCTRDFSGAALRLAATAGGDGKWQIANVDTGTVLATSRTTDLMGAWLLSTDEDGMSMPPVDAPLSMSRLAVGHLRGRLLTLADNLGYRTSNLQVIDGSTRSEHSNAFCTGFGRF